MAFRELRDDIKKTLPLGASERYATLEALERMQRGDQYDHLDTPFHIERLPGRKYIPLRERAPSIDFNLAHEITQDTLAELFGDEQFPIVRVMSDIDKQDDTATSALAKFIEKSGVVEAITEAYEDGVIGSVGVIIHKADNGAPFFEVLPGKWCRPIYRSKYSNELLALEVTYPIEPEAADKIVPGVSERPENRGAEWFWYRFMVGPSTIIDYVPMAEGRFAKIGEKDEASGEIIAFAQLDVADHGFKGRTPAAFAKNLGGRSRDLDGPCLWWPIRNLCVALDYSLSEVERGLRFTADPMLFIKKAGLASFIDADDAPAGYEDSAAQTTLGAVAQTDDHGSPVRGATQTIVGEDARFIEISANGIKEKREFARDLREYALEVLGGMKARAEHLKSAPSGTAIDKANKPLRRLVRRQRRPFGNGLLLTLLDLLVYGFDCGALDFVPLARLAARVPLAAETLCDWPNDETYTGADYLARVEAAQLEAGGSMAAPIQLISPEAAGKKLAGDLGYHEPFDTIKGDFDPEEVRNPPPAPAGGGIVKP